MTKFDTPKQIGYLALHCVVCGLFLAFCMISQNKFPVFYVYFGMEDSWGEYGTFVCYLLASFLIALCIRKNRDFRRPGYILLTLTLLFIAMEEISWGQRIFSIEPPYMIAKHNAQGELTIHNMYAIVDYHLVFIYAILSWAVAIPFLSFVNPLIKRVFQEIGMPIVPMMLMPYFVSSVFIYHAGFVLGNQDVSEQVLGVGFLLFAVHLFNQVDETQGVGAGHRFRIGFIVAFIVALGTAVLVKVKPANVYIKRFFLSIFAEQHYPEKGLHEQAKAVFQHIIHDPEVRTDDSLLRYGAYLQKYDLPGSTEIYMRALGVQNEAMAADPTVSNPHYLSGKIYALMNKPALSRASFEDAISLDNKYLSTETSDFDKVMRLMAIARSYLELDDKDKAVEQLQNADKIVENDWQKSKLKTLREEILQASAE